MERHKVCHVIFAAVFVLSAFTLWRSVFGIVYSSGSIWWIVSIVASTITFVSFGLFLIAARHLWRIFFISLLACLVGAAYALSVWGILFAVVSAGLLTSSAAHIREDIRSRIKIKLYSSFWYGFGSFVIALSLSVSVMYFGYAYQMPAADLLPKLEIGERTSSLITRAVRSMNPGFPALRDGNVTVDQFLSSAYGTNTEGFNALPVNSAGSGDEVQRKFFQENYERFSEITGTPVTGSESMSQVFLDMVNAKTKAFVAPKGVGAESPSAVLASVLALFVFLTVVSVGMIVRFLWLPLLSASFLLFRRSGCILVRNDMREVETIQT